MPVPLIQQVRVGAYVMGQKLRRQKRYPLVLMLEPLFRCNLACPGCGKIDYPAAILNQRLSVDECLDAVDECGAPMVSIPGGEPLIHPEIKQIVEGIVRQVHLRFWLFNAAHRLGGVGHGVRLRLGRLVLGLGHLGLYLSRDWRHGHRYLRKHLGVSAGCWKRA